MHVLRSGQDLGSITTARDLVQMWLSIHHRWVMKRQVSHLEAFRNIKQRIVSDLALSAVRALSTDPTQTSPAWRQGTTTTKPASAVASAGCLHGRRGRLCQKGRCGRCSRLSHGA
eukprot:1560361-Pleurochrysis_carterae.AAC.3